MAGGYDVSVKMNLVDNTSDVLKTIQKNMEKLIETAERYDAILGNTKKSSKGVNSMSNSQKNLNSQIDESVSLMDGLTTGVKRLVGAYVGMQTVKTAFDWSDELTLTRGKLAQLTDDVDGFMDKVYQMSQATRTSYMDNASQIAKMWQLTGGTDGVFETEEKLLQFNELLNQAFVLGGSGTREINASMYQLTQALSSGRLQGDELRSLAENAPFLINTVVDSIEEMYNAGKDQSEWIELTYNDLKKLGAEGVLTSEVITNAVLNSADEIRAAYENITPTWEQTFQTLKNQIQKISEPILKVLNEMINSESFQKMSQSLVKLFSVAMALLVPILELVMRIGAFISDNWSWIEPIVWGIVGAFAAYLTYVKLAKLYTIALGVAQGFQLLISKGVGLSMVNNNVALGIYNGLAPIAATMTNMLGAAKAFLAGATWSAVVAEYGLLAPILLIIAVIGALIAGVYLVIAAYNKWTGATLSATGVIMGAFYVLGGYLYNRIASIWNLLVSFAELITNLFTDPVYAVKKAFGEMAIAIIDSWMKVNDALINIVDSIADEINGLLVWVEKGFNAVIDAYNNTLGKKYGKRDKVSIELTSDPYKVQNAMLGCWKNSIQNWMGKPGDNYISLDKYKLDKKDYSELYNKGYDVGSGFANDVKEFFNPDKYTSELNKIPGAEEYLNSLPNYDGGNVPTSSTLPDDLSGVIDELEGIGTDTDDIKNMTKEELKYLRDIAEQKVINRFTTAEIKVTNHMNNNINSDRDIDGMADYFAEVLMKAADSTAEKINTTG